MFDFEALKKDVAVAAERAAHSDNQSRAIPDGWARIVCFDRNGKLIGRMNLPLEQALAKFQATVRGETPEGYGYSLLYAFDRPATRVGYHTYKGKTQIEVEHLKKLLSPAKAKRSSPRTKPSPAAEAASEAEPS